MSFIIIALIVFGLAYAAYMPFHETGVAWMKSLYQPAFSLPDWLGMSAWPVIYLLTSCSLWLIWQKRKEQNIRTAFWVFLVQFAVNIAWGPVIVNAQNLQLSVVYIYVLLLLVVLNMISFARISKLSGLLFLPYLLWTIYLVCIQTTVWMHG